MVRSQCAQILLVLVLLLLVVITSLPLSIPALPLHTKAPANAAAPENVGTEQMVTMPTPMRVVEEPTPLDGIAPLQASSHELITRQGPLPNAVQQSAAMISANSHVYLPLVMRKAVDNTNIKLPDSGCPNDSDACRFLTMGIHLGNRPSVAWDNVPEPYRDPEIGKRDFLYRLKGDQAPYVWPAVAVVQSRQVFTIERYKQDEPGQDFRCRIKNATVTTPRRSTLRFLARASHYGKIVIRIVPSPGNFEDAEDVSQTHRLIDIPQRIGDGTYCHPGDDTRLPDEVIARDISDIYAEMDAIMDAINRWNGDHVPDDPVYFIRENLYFVPANEPNIEWYRQDPVGSDFRESRFDITAWKEMDAYFAALYDYKESQEKNTNAIPGDDIRILTPPMAQWAGAEFYNLGCAVNKKPFSDFVNNVPPGLLTAGYNYMQQTYEVKNDGYAWHNYWLIGFEGWGITGKPCPPGSETLGNHHVFQLFPPYQPRLLDGVATEPTWDMQGAILHGAANPKTFILEASWHYGLPPFNVRSKDMNNGFSFAYSARGFSAEVLPGFVAEEERLMRQNTDHYVAIWHLTQDQFVDQPLDSEPLVDACTDLTALHDPPIDEKQWHMAYLQDGTECRWFTHLWNRKAP